MAKDMVERILMVDDNEKALNAFKRIMRNDFQLDVAANAEEAMQKLESGQRYAVIVTDMKMPGTNGVELLMKVRQIAPATTRIMLTGDAEQQTAIDALNKGRVTQVLKKPCPANELKQAIIDGIKEYHEKNKEMDT
jgi:DNA-binding NtrC family response regulator